MADYSGEYGYPYPRVDEYGNPVGPVDQYGNPIPREPSEQPAYSSGGAVPSSYGVSDVTAVAPADYATGVAAGLGLGGATYPHEVVAVGGAVSPGGAAHTQTDMHEGELHGGHAPGETTVYAYEGMVGSGMTTGDQIQPVREEHTTLGETLRRSGSSSSSSSSSEDDGQGGRQRKKKSLKEKIREKLPGSSHKHEEPTAGTGTHAAGTHEKKGIIEKIKDKLPGHH